MKPVLTTDFDGTKPAARDDALQRPSRYAQPTRYLARREQVRAMSVRERAPHARFDGIGDGVPKGR
jgi:hypothetical protein